MYHPPPLARSRPTYDLSPPGHRELNMQHFITPDRPEKWTAGVDWFRWKVDRMKDVREVRSRVRALQEKDVQNASSLKPWKFCGYEGFQTDSVRYGERGGLLLWEASGSRAPVTMATLEPSSGYALRIDLQLTLSLSRTQPSFGTSLLPSSPTPTHTSRRARSLVGLTTQNQGLWLGTVGRRTSPNFLRIYDKGVESKTAEPGKVWRVELEAKYTHARQLCRDHLTSLNNPKFCASYVVSSLQRSGSSFPFAGLADSPIDIKLGRKDETTAGKLAIWLSQTVAPTLPRLLTVFTVAEVLEMLKLSAVAAPTGKGHALDRATEHDRARRSSMAGELSLRDP